MRGARRLVPLLTVLVLGMPRVAPASDMDAFGRCLARKHAVLYGASWCPQCARQIELLGDAMEHVEYVECSEDGRRQQTPECDDADIHGYPTWQFGDGSRARGVQSPKELASRTRCSLSGEAPAPAAATRAPRRHPRGTPDGPLIIDVR
jgi:hypothetical protein